MPCPCKDDICHMANCCARLASIEGEYHLAEKNGDPEKQMEMMQRFENAFINNFKDHQYGN